MAIRQRSTGDQINATPSPCKKCGCNDIRATPSGSFCRHCGKRWIGTLGSRANAEPVDEPPQTVYYHITRCPECGSDATKVTSTRRPVRHHKCKSCDHNFKSFEK